MQGFSVCVCVFHTCVYLWIQTFCVTSRHCNLWRKLQFIPHAGAGLCCCLSVNFQQHVQNAMGERHRVDRSSETYTTVCLSIQLYICLKYFFFSSCSCFLFVFAGYHRRRHITYLANSCGSVWLLLLCQIVLEEMADKSKAFFPHLKIQLTNVDCSKKSCWQTPKSTGNADWYITLNIVPRVELSCHCFACETNHFYCKEATIRV